MENDIPNGVTIESKGRWGNIHYKINNYHVKFYYELSGTAQYQFLVWFEEELNWLSPENTAISSAYRIAIKRAIIETLEANGISSNIYQQS